jgi:hypothetical protein
MSARNQRTSDPEPYSAVTGNPWFYACPECGELPRSCICLRRSVRDRIADAIHFPADAESMPFLFGHRPPAIEPPSESGAASVG